MRINTSRRKTLMLVLVVCVCAFASVAQATMLDFYGLWGERYLAGGLGTPGNNAYGDGIVDGGFLLKTPFFTMNPPSETNAYYTYSFDGLNVVNTQMVGIAMQTTYAGGAITFHHDEDPFTIGGGAENQTWTKPRTTAQWTDGNGGLPILTADIVTAFGIWYPTLGIGTLTAVLDWTGGNAYTHMGNNYDAYGEATALGSAALVVAVQATQGVPGGVVGDGYAPYGYQRVSDGYINPIPEPGSLMLLGSGLVLFAGFMKRKNRA